MAEYLLILTVTLWLMLVRPAFSKAVPKSTSLDAIEYSIGRMTRDIADNYFTGDMSHCIVVVTEKESNIVDSLPKFFPVVQIKVLHEMNDTGLEHVVDDDLAHQILTALDLCCLSFIIQVHHPKVIVQLLAKKARKSRQRENRRVLLVPSLDILREHGPDPKWNLNPILELPEMSFLPDLIIANQLPSEEGVIFEIVTHSFIGKTSWGAKIVIDIWTEKEGFIYKTNLYYDKVSNGMGRTLTFAAFNYPPYTIIEPPGVFDGTEMRLGMEFARIHNYSWAVLTDSKNEWGETWENESGNGILGNVLMDRADLGFGALYLWYNEYQRLDFSFPYIRTGITCLAPKPKPLPGWMSPVLPFSIQMWGAVGASLLITTVALYFVTKASHKYLGRIDGEETDDRFTTLLDCALRSLGLLVLQAPGSMDDPSIIKAPNRHLLSWILVVFLLVTTCYGGGLASILTVPKFEDPIDTVADLAASNIRWAATHEAWVFSIKEATEPLISHVYQQFQVMSEATLNTLAPLGKMAFSVERLPAGHYAVGDYLTEKAVQTLRIMKQDIYWEQCVTVTRKGSPYMQILNKLIHRLLDSGLLLQWEGQVARRFLSERVQTEVRQSAGASTSDGPTTLKLAHVQGVFILLIFGLILSAVVFMGELLTFKYNRRNKWTTITSTGQLYAKKKTKEFNPYLNH